LIKWIGIDDVSRREDDLAAVGLNDISLFSCPAACPWRILETLGEVVRLEQPDISSGLALLSMMT